MDIRLVQMEATTVVYVIRCSGPVQSRLTLALDAL